MKLRWLSVACLATCSLSVAHAQSELTSAGAPPPESETRFDAVPDFSFACADGTTLSRADLDGHAWVAVPFFVRCTGPCPSITRDLRHRLHDRLAGTDIRIVSFSVDPELDTPEKLAAYAEQIEADPERWAFVTSDNEAAMHAFLNDGLKVPVERVDGDVPVGESVVHGTRMAVVDPNGLIAGWYELADPALADAAESEALLASRYRLIEARARAVSGLDHTWGAKGRSRIPLVNATLNGIAFVLLILGIARIKRGDRRGHERAMKAAFAVSAAFLACYLYYHFAVIPLAGGPTKFNGTGFAKTAYLLMLLTHVVLAIVNLPMVLRVLWLAHKQDWPRHKRLARWTFPIWVYVSLTGVLVYLVLYPFNPPPV